MAAAVAAQQKRRQQQNEALYTVCKSPEMLLLLLALRTATVAAPRLNPPPVCSLIINLPTPMSFHHLTRSGLCILLVTVCENYPCCCRSKQNVLLLVYNLLRAEKNAL